MIENNDDPNIENNDDPHIENNDDPNIENNDDPSTPIESNISLSKKDILNLLAEIKSLKKKVSSIKDVDDDYQEIKKKAIDDSYSKSSFYKSNKDADFLSKQQLLLEGYANIIPNAHHLNSYIELLKENIIHDKYSFEQAKSEYLIKLTEELSTVENINNKLPKRKLDIIEKINSTDNKITKSNLIVEHEKDIKESLEVIKNSYNLEKGYKMANSISLDNKEDIMRNYVGLVK